MSKYIDSDKLIETIKQHHYLLRDKSNSTDYGMYTVGIEQAIAEQQTVEAEPIRHAKSERIGGIMWACSSCYYELPNGMCKYCPHCGAKMDEVVEQ